MFLFHVPCLPLRLHYFFQCEVYLISQVNRSCSLVHHLLSIRQYHLTISLHSQWAWIWLNHPSVSFVTWIYLFLIIKMFVVWLRKSIDYWCDILFTFINASHLFTCDTSINYLFFSFAMMYIYNELPRLTSCSCIHEKLKFRQENKHNYYKIDSHWLLMSIYDISWLG